MFGRAGGRGRGHPEVGELRKPGEFLPADSVSQDDEKPPVQSSEQTDSPEIVHDVVTETKVENSKEVESKNVDNILQRAVNNPVFIPKTVQPVRSNPPTNSSGLASAVNAPVFVPRKAFVRYEETPDERLKVIENFVNNKIQQLTEDPGLLDEISMSMANYLSAFIKVENDMTKLSDLLFEKCVSEQNFQYTGSRMANYMDKNLNPKTAVQSNFRKAFLKRCSHANSQFKSEIVTNPERAYNVAMFLGELLMSYKTNDGQTITKFVTVVSDIIKQLLVCSDRKLLICAGKLLKLTGNTLDQNDEIFATVADLAKDPRMDRTAQILFTRVCELKKTSWGQHEIPQTVAYTHQNTYAAQGFSMYFPSMDGMLEEQAPNLPVFSEEEWNEYISDGSGQDEVATNNVATNDVATNDVAINDEETEDELYNRMYWEQYGNYAPYATEDNWSSGGTGVVDDYGDDYETFLNQLP